MRMRRLTSAPASTRPKIRTQWLEEPALAFAGGREALDQKEGLARFGPASLGESRHPAEIRLGFIGSGRSIDVAQTWFRSAAEGVAGDPAKHLPPFPGFADDRGFFTRLVMPDAMVETITAHELDAVATPKRVAERFQEAVETLSGKLRLLRQRDDRPDVVVLALPDELLKHTQRVKFNDPDRGLVYRDFRRAIKAELMRHQIPTQILLERVSGAVLCTPIRRGTLGSVV